MTSQKLNEEHEILRRFMAVVVSSAFWASLICCFVLALQSVSLLLAISHVYMDFVGSAGMEDSWFLEIRLSMNMSREIAQKGSGIRPKRIDEHDPPV